MQENHKLKLKKGQHLLAIDYGTRFSGLAQYKFQTDPFILATGRIAYQNDQQLINDIQKLIDDEFIDIVVLGIPYFTDGRSSTMTKTIEAFGQLLTQALKVPVYKQDETLSSFEAEERMRNSPRYNFKVDLSMIDSVAATIILEDFLAQKVDNHNN